MRFVVMLLFLFFTSFIYSSKLYSDCNDEYQDTIFLYKGFQDPDLFNYNGSAYLKDDTLTLVRYNNSYKCGSAWYKTKMNITDGFLTEFTFNTNNGRIGLADDDGSLPGADGLVFVIQNTGFYELGGPGHYLGYHSIRNSLAIEIDLYENSYQINPYHAIYNDPNGNHMAIQTNGTDANSCAHYDYTLDMNDEIPEIKNDGTMYHVRVLYDNLNYTLTVCLAGEDRNFTQVLFVDDIDIDNLLDLDEGKAIVGFTSGTGDAYMDHNVTSWMWCSLEEEINDIKITEVWLPHVSAYPGEEISIPLYGKIITDEPKIIKSSYTVEIHIPEIAFVGSDPIGFLSNGYNVFTLTDEAIVSSTDSVLGYIDGIVLFCEIKDHPLIIENLSWSDPEIQVIKKDGSLHIKDVCFDNGRLIEAFTPTNIAIKPNPASDELFINLITEESGTFNLKIFDVLGNIIDARSIMKTNSTEEEFDIVIDISNLSNGSYYIILNSRGNYQYQQFNVVR